MLTKSQTSGFDVETTLAHFAIITYMVEPAALRPHVHKRFELDCITSPDGTQKALISVVPFVDRDFHFVRFPWSKWVFGQTNYRAYVTDSETGEHVVWFFGTSLASITVNVPHFVWKIPWHKADISFSTQYDQERGRYSQYRMVAKSQWANAELELEDSGRPPQELIGFPDVESGLVVLTHPLYGYYYRRDGKLGGYSIWHDRLQTTQGRAKVAKFSLLQKLGLLSEGSLSEIHSVLIQPETRFTVYLPPFVV